MATHRARDDLDEFLDTIDLTLSSPEPDPQPAKSRPSIPSRPGPAPRPAPTPSTQPAHLQFTQQSTQRPSTQTQPRSTQNSRQRTSRTAVYQNGRNVDPHHLSRILETCDVRAIRHVLLTLCKTSPALSGAVARGLAPYSVFAQAVIKNSQRTPQGNPQRNPTHTPVKTDPYRTTPKREPPSRESGSEYAQRVRDRVAQEGAATTSSARPGSVSSSARVNSPALGRAVGMRVPGSYPSSSLQEEREGSPTDSDDSNHIVPIAGTQSRENRTPLQSSSSNHNHQSLSQSQVIPTTTTHGERKTRCGRCYESFDEGLAEPGTCIYHPTTDLTRIGNQSVFDCCHKPTWASGCTSGDHVSREAAPESRLAQTQNQVRVSAATPYEQTNKRRRL
jgi:hypothetical protein